MTPARSPQRLPAGVELVRRLNDPDAAEPVLLVRRAGHELVLRAGPSALAELALAGRVLAPGLVPPLEWGTLPDGEPFVLRPWVEGRPFAEAASTASPERLAAWTRTLLETLHALHEAGVVHRDVKSDNVLVGDEGVHLVDLHLASPSGASGAGGSPLTVAPEVLLGQGAGPAADLFSAGAMVALALCGPPRADFHERFPAAGFWDASGLDPSRLPQALRPLVAALVRRLPAARPASAAAALVLLPEGGAPAPDPRLPFLRGREAVLDDVVRRLDAGPRVVLVSCEPDEAWLLLDQLHVSLAMRGRRVTRRRPDPVAPPARAGEVVLLAPGSELEAEVLARALAEEAGGWTCVGVVAPDDGAALDAALGGRLEPGELARVVRESWPPVGPALLREHLDGLLAGAAPAAAESLARSLHGWTGGSWGRVDAALRRAVDDGVLRRAEAGGWVARLERWPTAPVGPDGPSRPPSDEAARVLATLSALRGERPIPLVAAASGLPAPRFAGALAELRAEGRLHETAHRPPRLGLRSPASARAAYEALDATERAAVHRRCLDALPAGEAGNAERLRHRLRAGADASLVAEALDAIDRSRRAGRPAEALDLLATLRETAHALLSSEPLRSRADAAEARLELSRGEPRRGLEILHGRHGPDLDEAGAEVLVAAALAEESAGDRERAARWLDRAEGREDGGAVAAWIRLGRAWGASLDGDHAGVLDRLAGEPGPDTPAEAGAAMLHLRGAALTALARPDEARAAYAEALERAADAGERLAQARGEINLAHLERRCGHLARAVEGLHRALDLLDAAGHPAGRAHVLNNLGVVQRDLGDLAQARTLVEDALALRRRVGDAHGAALSLGNLALIGLDAGQPGAALELLDRAERLLERGRYAAELETLRWQRVAALSLASRQVEAAALARRGGEPAARDRWLARWSLALLELASGRESAARAALSEALDAVDRAARPGDVYRLAALRLVLDPDDEGARDALREATRAVDGPIRRAETAWRLAHRAGDVTDAQLAEWHAVFERAGRTDLVAAAGRRLAARARAAGDRRVLAARAAEAAEALVDGLEAHEKRRALDRLAALAGGFPEAARGPGLAWVSVFQRRLAAEEDLEGLLAAVVDMALELTGARRGLVVVKDEDDERAELAVARGRDHEVLASEQAVFSRTVVERALASGQPLVTTDAASDHRFRGTASIDALRLRSILCHPFVLPGGGRGALLLDDELHDAAFDGADVDSIGLLADQAGLAISWLRRRAEIERLNERLARRVASQEEELDRARRMLRRRGRVAPVAGLVGESEALRSVFALVERLAPTELPVLVTGPSGSGKDLVARALHERSPRAGGPLVVENVAALPATLLESELFGHVRGAFTGADRDRPGLFAEAHGGTFVLDEIGEMPLELQAKLLRVLESGESRPVGSRRPQRIDVRIVAATNRDLLERVGSGAFREDLYYRLNAAEIRLPPLEERLDDVPLLVAHFLDRLNERHGTAKQVTDAVVGALVERPWPGQVRELANEVARLYHLSGESLDDPSLVRRAAVPGSGARGEPDGSLRLEDVERAAIRRALAAAGGRKDRAARLLGISRAGLYTKLKRLGLGPDA